MTTPFVMARRGAAGGALLRRGRGRGPRGAGPAGPTFSRFMRNVYAWRYASDGGGRSHPSNRLMTFRTLGAVVVAATASVACSNKNAKPKTPPVPVAVTRVVRRSVPYNLTADGTVEPM